MKTRFVLFLVLPLVVIGLSIIPPAFAQYNQPQSTMSVSTDKLSYNYRDIVRINGQGAESYSISIRIMSPSGDEITKLSTFKTSAGEFSTLWIIPSGIEKGTYIIKASDATQTAQTSFTLGTPIATQETGSKTKIPEWIKNNAGWWADGAIGDGDFTSGIQYMIKENIMVIPDLPENTQMELKDEKRAMGLERDTNVPDWVRNNAGWWSDGLISEDDFVNGIKWLVEHGIIRV